ncbi:P-loop containing nucleoside triphosphate hydrolase protein, partial [Sporodiniella umbellata]
MPKRKFSTKDTKTLPVLFQALQKKFEKVNLFYAFCDAKLTTLMTLPNLQRAIPDLTLDDLAAVNVIIPQFVQFNLIDTVWEIQFGKPTSKKAAKEKHDEWWTKSTPAVKPTAIKKLVEQQNDLFETSLHSFLNRCEEKGLDPCHCLLQETEKHVPLPIDLDDWSDEEIVPETLAQVIENLTTQPFYTNQLLNKKTFPSQPCVYGKLELPQPIAQALSQKSIHRLYSHQAEAIQGLQDGHHVIVSTSTASGKSLIYQIPVLEHLLQKKQESKALFIFPTKALAQDQKRALQSILEHIPSLKDTLVSTFDGDTPSEQRTFIRDHTQVIFTNPDMLHYSILPNHSRWASFLSCLKLIVVDEIHVYNGLFGLHMAYIMRRLRRLCDHYKNTNYQFVSCSATVTHPDKHMRDVFGIQDTLFIDKDGAPCGQKEFILWNPPLVNPNDQESERKSAVAEGALVLEYLLEKGIKTIAFCKVRRTCELLMKTVRESLEKKQKNQILQKIMSYRGGYTPKERRVIEQKMFKGDLLAVIATNALELGVDIGSLDAVLMIGVPSSSSAMWQQSGRSGRRNTDSLSLVIMDKNPIDQHYASHPLKLFSREPDSLLIDLDNPFILESHLQCAAEELPIDTAHDHNYFGSTIIELCQQHLVSIGKDLFRPDPRFRPYPSQYVNIRSINEDTFAVIDITNNKNVVIEEIETRRAGFEIYEGAIFIHQGKTFLVEECNIDKRFSKVRLVRVDWTTTQRDYTDVDVIKTNASKTILSTTNPVCYGQVRVSTTVFGYYRINQRNLIIDSHEVYMDPIITHTSGVWSDVPPIAVDQLKKQEIDPMAAVHAASHCLISLMPRYTASSAVSLRTECKNPHAMRPRPI